MSDRIGGRIIRGTNPAKQKILVFKGQLKEAQWADLIARIQQLLASTPEFRTVKLAEAAPNERGNS